ncbi:efflux RND transporter permease subunit [Futiania mangrovi]|uniref:Multidrug efflux RND transporter permease subunit n=1 Tax=Futiania mangrovi TaxID=2959716 RepID=A0A9J6PDM7_9PROT|nr:multidrug efflux RND transporter permease subunit [Futiania mangrovii]MCP1336470.1 multidrug efflux RND transporter permease subunit [Futiania mangrovii]
MQISELSIRRPVLATVMSLVVVLLGLVSYERLSVREYPNIDPPVVNVRTGYPGASAAIIESQVTQVLEESLAGIEGIDYLTSTSRQESSQITVSFNLDRDPEAAAADVRDRVSRVRGRLPDEVSEPVIQKSEADAQAIIYMALSSDRSTPLEISDYADRYITDQLQIVPGVAEVRIFGQRRYAMRLWLDPERLAANGLTVQEVETALRRQNVEIPAGRIESREREFSVLSETDLRTAEEFNELIISEANGYLVRLRDVGRAELGPQDERRISRFNGATSVTLGIVKQATANPLDVSNGIRSRLPGIQDSLPEGWKLDIGYDKSVFISESIKNVYTTIAEAVVLVVLIIFFFLRSMRATLIPLVTIPVSLVGAFALMYLFGFSINTLTLLSLVLAIGLVVDDAIVMLENIYRHLEMGKSPFKAAIDGAREITFAVLAMTITLAAVYIPIGFMEGKTGRLFTEFAWALAGAVLISGFVALTLSPMMCSKLLKQDPSKVRHNWLYNLIERFLRGLNNGYRALLRVSLAAPLLVILIGLAVAGAGGWLFTLLKSELAPYEDQGTIVAIISGPEGATVEYMDRYVQQLEDIYTTPPEADRYVSIIGFPVLSRGIGFLNLQPWSERERTAQEIAAELRGKMFSVPGVNAFPTTPPPLGQSARSKPVEIVVLTSRPYDELAEAVDAILGEARKLGFLDNLDSDLALDAPQIKVELDRSKAAALGISVETVGRTMETMLAGRQVTRFKRDGRQYDVIVQMEDVDRSNPDDLRRLYVRSSLGEMVPLSNLVRIEETVAPRELNHFNKLRSATISANLAPGVSLGEGLAALEKIASDTIPGTMQVDYSGTSRDFLASSGAIYLTFVLALIFIYLVLSAQFESFIDPFIIMLTVPLSMTGGLLALYLTGSTLNIYSQVGLVTLIGIITKHGILIVEFANQIREQGARVREAVVEASVLRLRPILMTTGAMVLGAVPLAISTGAGAQSRQDIGLVIVGGMLVGTLFTLFVIPAVYTLIRRDRPETAAQQQRVAPAPAE